MSAVPSIFRSLSRELRRSPWFLVIAVITLGVGIGATTAIFAVVDAVLIRPLPYPDADRLVALKHDSPGFGMDDLGMSDGTYVLYRRENRVLADFGIYRGGAVTLAGGGGPERLESADATGSIFSALRVRPALGRMIQEADEKPGAEKVAVLSDSLWRRRFGGDPGAVGRTLRADGVERRIVGVMPPGFLFPTATTAVWLPLAIDPAHYRIGDFSDSGLGRLQVLSMVSDGFVSPGYFQAMGIPVIAGRAFARQDVDPAAKVVLVSRALAERLWPGKSPLGHRLAVGASAAPDWRTIIGVVGDVRVRGMAEPPQQRVYYPMLRAVDRGIWIPHGFSLVVKGKGDPARLAGPVREAVRSLDPNLAISDVRSLRELETRAIVRTTFTMLLLVIAAAVALLLGAVGIYGVISYVVSQRTREIGVRMALGARRQEISRMVLRDGLWIILAGVAAGLVAALAATRLLASLLYGVSPTDPWTFAAVPLLLVAVALLASWAPAQRASSVEPLEAIRHE